MVVVVVVVGAGGGVSATYWLGPLATDSGGGGLPQAARRTPAIASVLKP